YLALSYCWENSMQLSTTTATLEQRKNSIIVSEMSKTHQDAVKITRALCMKYLWIDSLYICQDEMEDRARESA
ncbi:hypothetical protein K469DRAFT_505574, partial [Zopfia rhizophila CBS 207.26]